MKTLDRLRVRKQQLLEEQKAAIAQYNQLGAARDQVAGNVNAIGGRLAEIDDQIAEEEKPEAE
jgi:hypothetical protein